MEHIAARNRFRASRSQAWLRLQEGAAMVPLAVLRERRMARQVHG